MRPALEAVDDIGQARTGFRNVGSVNLGDVAQANNLGARPGTRHQGFHLLGCKVLCLVQNQVFVQKGTTTHKIHGTDLDAVAEQVVGRCAAPVTTHIGARQDFQVIHQRTHPGRHFFFLCARQEADVFTHRHRDARHDDFLVAVFFQGLGQTSGQRQQRLAGACRTDQADEIHIRIHQQVKREVLFPIARADAPYSMS